MALLTSADYPAVRAQIDTSLDADALPDVVIALDTYHKAAELAVLAVDAAAESRTGNDAIRVKTAAICYCAALICPALPTLTSESLGGYQYQRIARDWQVLANLLNGRAAAELTAVTSGGSATSARRPTMFARAPGGRGA